MAFCRAAHADFAVSCQLIAAERPYQKIAFEYHSNTIWFLMVFEWYLGVLRPRMFEWYLNGFLIDILESLYRSAVLNGILNYR